MARPRNILRLGVFKTHPDIILPAYATDGSACFDLRFSAKGKTQYSGFLATNKPFTREFSNGKIYISAGERVMVPTGIIFNVPYGYSMKIYSRSGLAIKKGLIMINAPGVVDYDYVEETFLLLQNTTTADQWIEEGDRLAQAELEIQLPVTFEEEFSKPREKTGRTGGMGSTGTQ